MSNAEHKPTNQPAEGAAFQPLGYLLGLQFQMPLKLVRQKGLEFAAKLAQYIDPRGVELEETQWVFTQPLGESAAGFFRVAVHETEIALEAGLTGNRLEWFEDRSRFILTEFHKTFAPALLLVSTARCNGILQIDGDARTFLAAHVTRFDAKRLRVLNRPVQLFGIRLSLPPYQVQRPPKGKRKKPTPELIDSHIEARAESLLTDPTKLYLEILTQWQIPKKWDDKATHEVVGRPSVVLEFLRERLIPCLITDPNSGST